MLRGEARFTGSASVTVDGKTLTAKRFVIAAGSRAVVPPIPGLAGIPHKKGGVQAAMDYIVAAHSGGARAAAE